MVCQGRAARGVRRRWRRRRIRAHRTAWCFAPERDDDADTAAALHAGQIGEGFLSFLGPEFLRHLYRRITRSPESFLLVVEEEKTTVGFLAGSTDVAALYRAFLWRDGPAAALACSGRLLRSWRRVIETLRHGTGWCR